MKVGYHYNKEIYQDLYKIIEIENQDDYERLKSLDSKYKKQTLIDKLVREGKAEVINTDKLKQQGDGDTIQIEIKFLDDE